MKLLVSVCRPDTSRFKGSQYVLLGMCHSTSMCDQSVGKSKSAGYRNIAGGLTYETVFSQLNSILY